MKEIGKEKFGLLYDKLTEHLIKNNGDMKTVGIETGETNQILSNLWQDGKTWETIILIIAYHYSRTDSLLLNLSNIKTLIHHKISFSELQHLLGINKKKSKCIEVKKDVFEEEFNSLWPMFRGQKKIGELLKKLGIEDRSLLESYWNQGYQWETITAIIVSRRAKTCNEILVNTEFGNYYFNGSDYYRIFETILYTK